MFVMCVVHTVQTAGWTAATVIGIPGKYGEMELDTSLQGESSAASVKQSFISADSKKKKKGILKSWKIHCITF